MTMPVADMQIPETTFISIIGSGTSRALYFNAEDLPRDRAVRDAILLDIMGAPEMNWVRGLGGGDGLTLKIAVLDQPTHQNADIDYEFIQAARDAKNGRPVLLRSQGCGNILVGVGPYAVENGFVKADDPTTRVCVHEITPTPGAITTLTVQTPDGVVTYKGNQVIPGVTGEAAPVLVNFDIPDASILLPTGNVVDVVDGKRATIVRWGMQTGVARAEDFGLTGYEDPKDIERDAGLMARVNQFRIAVGVLGGFGDAETLTERDINIPKIYLAAMPRHVGNTLAGHCMIKSVEMHTGLGVKAAASVGWAALLPGSAINDLADIPAGNDKLMKFEHSTGVRELNIVVEGTEVAPLLVDGYETSAAWKINTAPKFEVNINGPRIRELIALAGPA